MKFVDIIRVSRALILLTFLLQPLVAEGQFVVEHRQGSKPDTLTLRDRLSLKTNTIDWLAMMPNLQVELELGNTNHNHWSIGLGARYNWQTKNTFKPAQVYNMMGLRAEVRYYWRTQQIDTIYQPAHAKHNYWGRLWSTRRYKLKHLNTTYYRGAYVGVNKYSFLLTKDGFQGKAFTAGFTYGIIKPLYVFSSGNSLDFDLGFSAGLCYTQYNKYCHDRESDCYPVTAKEDWHLLPYPVLSEVRIAFVYRLGKYPMTKKYRWRYDVDEDYRAEWKEKMYKDYMGKKYDEDVRKSMEVLQKRFDEYYGPIYLRTQQVGIQIVNTKTESKPMSKSKAERKSKIKPQSDEPEVEETEEKEKKEGKE